MILPFSHIMARILRLMPKTKTIHRYDMSADFFVPVTCHYVCDDLREMATGTREPELYHWLNDLPQDAVYFDIGTSYGQEAALASSLAAKNVTVIGFDCSLLQSHFCCLNKALNQDRFRFVFAAVAEKSGQMIGLTTNSDTHLPHLHKKNVPYHYEVISLSLDDFAAQEDLWPTHIKMDIDGAEFDALRGAKQILANPRLTDVFIEIDHDNLGIIDFMKDCGFEVAWRLEKQMNDDVLFKRVQAG